MEAHHAVFMDQSLTTDMEAVATMVRLTYEEREDCDVGSGLRAESYRRYLRTSRHGSVSIGDEWEELVNGGCGTTRQVTLRVKEVSGGRTIGDETTFEFVPETEH